MEAAVALRRPATEFGRGSPTCARAAGSRAVSRCVRKDRLTSKNGGTYLSVELRDRTGTLSGPGLPRGRPHRPALRARRRGPRVAGESSASAASWSPSSTTSSAWSRGPTTRRSSCPPPTARSRSSRASSSTSRARSTTRPCARSVERLLLGGPVAAEFRRAPCTRAGHHAYLGGLARAHGLRGHAGRRALPAPSAARLRPADGGGAPPRRRQGPRVHLRGASSS